MNFPAFSQLSRENWPSETSSLLTASSSGESCKPSVPKLRNARGTESLQTLHWRGMDSKSQFRDAWAPIRR